MPIKVTKVSLVLHLLQKATPGKEWRRWMNSISITETVALALGFPQMFVFLHYDYPLAIKQIGY